MEQRRYIIGLNSFGVPPDQEAWIVSSPVQARMRVVSLVVTAFVGAYFDVLDGAVADKNESPFVTLDPVSGHLFQAPEGGAFDLPVAERDQVVAVRVRNIDIVRHDFRGAFLAVAPEASLS